MERDQGVILDRLADTKKFGFDDLLNPDVGQYMLDVADLKASRLPFPDTLRVLC